MEISRTPYYIELIDGAGKKATGYLAGVGAGETLGGAIAEDDCADDDTADWAHDVNATLTFDADHYNYANTAYSHAIWINNKAVIQGQLYKESVDTKDGTASSIPIVTRFFILDPIVDLLSLSLGDTAAGWVTHSAYPNAKALNNLFQIGICALADLGGNNVQFKNFYLKRVTDPPSTAVHIVSSLNGTTRNWESVESGFNPNTIASWKIYDLAHPGMYLPSDGSTFNRGDFTAGNAFFWSSLDLSLYAGTLMEADSLRQRIILEVDTRLKTILIANGYKTNMGQNVFEWKTDPFQTSEIDGLTYRDRTEERTAGCGVYDLVIPLEIEIASSSPAGIRKCLADLEKAVFVDETWGGLAWYTELRTNEMAVEKKENLLSASKIILEIEYQTGRGHPD